jgi:hypothetical protein
MTRTILIAGGVVAIVLIAYFAVIDTNWRTGTRGIEQTQTLPVKDDSDVVAQDNMSNRIASDVATDEAFERAQAGEEPVQDTVDSARAVAGQTGAVGGSAFTAEGYDRLTVVEAIVTSDLDEARKEDLMAELDRAEPEEQQLEEVLAEVRLALALEQ